VKRVARAPAGVRSSRVGPCLTLAAIVAFAGLECSGGRETRLYPLVSAAPAARNLSVTVDQCDCDLCRIALSDPTTLLTVFSRTGLPVGQEVAATTCFVDTSLAAVLECGSCPGPGSCAASVTVHATGDAGEVDLSPTLGCVTPPGAGEQCQARQSFTLDSTVPSTNCTL
jgi:hypothetical protein